MADPTLEPIQLTCPQCHAPVNPQDATCNNCGTDIALVTLIAERELIERTVLGGIELLRPAAAEQLVPRLGEYLVRSGYVTQAQLQAALAQQAATQADPPRLLGETLVKMGALSREALDRVIARQILQLHSALIEANRTLEKRVAERTAELESALVKLTEFNQLKANFVANISHELRTPLAQIKGYNALLSDESFGSLTSEQRDALRVTTHAIDRLEQLIDDLISYATTAKGELTLRLQSVSAGAVITRVIEKYAARAQKQDLTLKAEFSPGLPRVTADEEKLHWVLLQLVDNALKFTPGGGQVTVTAAPQGRLVWFSVRDTGLGIPADRLEEIFEPFRQLDGASTRRHGGTGLGLALVRRIVEAHGSRMMVDSQEGRGSTFAFTLAQAQTRPD